VQVACEVAGFRGYCRAGDELFIGDGYEEAALSWVGDEGLESSM
jgi:hypothetical protein